MKRLIIFAAILFALTFSLCAIAFSQYDTREATLTVSGRVVSVDPQASVIVIRTMENMVFSVAPNAKIVNSDGFDIRLSDINPGNYVSVDYYDDRSGKHIITNIEVDYKR